MKKVIVFAFFVVVLCVSGASADIIYVPGDYPTIQEGINAALSGDTVMVLAGTYYENLFIAQPISLIGEHRDDVIIDGSDSSDVVFVGAGGVNVRNLTITNSGTGEVDAGLEINLSDNCIIELCRFTGNYVGLDLYCSSHNRISRCIFESNTHGIRFWEFDYPGYHNYQNVIENNVLDNNALMGVLFEHTGGTYHHSGLVIGNRINANETGISMIMSMQNEICRNHIKENSSWGIIHMICIGGGGQNVFHHNNFVQNNGDTLQACNMGLNDDVWYSIAEQEGNHWTNYAGSDNNGDGIGDTPHDIFGDACVDLYPLMDPLEAVIEGGVMDAAWQPIEGAHVQALGTEIISITSAQGQYYLPELEGGNYDIQVTHPDYQDTIVLGVANTIGETSLWDIVMRIIADVDEGSTIPSKFMLAQNYPNPFNASTMIEYELPIASEVTIGVYDVLGRQIEILQDGRQQPGSHQLVWQADNYSSGVYFYKIEAGDFIAVKQMMLLK